MFCSGRSSFLHPLRFYNDDRGIPCALRLAISSPILLNIGLTLSLHVKYIALSFFYLLALYIHPSPFIFGAHDVR